ncbi:ABC-type multidrug transport system fused ATPase/permease subunit [Dysgonomonadaceae bacterium PH5-43]|nr:ABC-type multidrug transport system fused ATPase/permease subunit [Dysgonomonadaceae bacterium PH5-43]
MYQSIYSHYNKRIAEAKHDLSAVKKKLYSIGTIRLMVFLLTIFAAIILRSYGALFIVSVIVVGLLLFLFLVVKYDKYYRLKEYLETSILCDENELKGLDYNFSAFDGAKEKVDSNHFFSLDLDIFGDKSSLFQSINRTCTSFGRKLLINWFEFPLSNKKEIEVRQEAVKELGSKSDFVHNFVVTGLTNASCDSDYEEIENFVKTPDFIKPRKLWKTLSFVVPLCWVVLIALVSLSIIPGQTLVLAYILFFLLSESRAKQVNDLQKMTGKKVDILRSYSALILSVENETFTSARLKSLQTVFLKDNEKASAKFKKFSQLANELEQRANLLVHMLLNPLILWDIKKAIQLEEWKGKHGDNLIVWIKTLGEFDAYCSLGNFMFNHPDYTFPVINKEYFVMEGKELGHPLMNRDKCVKNNIDIKNDPFFLIITGANMAGKSTYLRTIGVNFLLSCVGAPVCAKELTVTPAKLVTSLRTSDSLNDNESYFFAELKRLKIIIDELKSDEKLFIILDEILKGTNSVDKQKGSLGLIQQFVSLKSCGIIATHDLLLGTLEDKFPDNIKNYRFEADITNDELSFTYQLREGIAQNMNASFLMQKMGIL